MIRYELNEETGRGALDLGEADTFFLPISTTYLIHLAFLRLYKQSPLMGEMYKAAVQRIITDDKSATWEIDEGEFDDQT